MASVLNQLLVTYGISTESAALDSQLSGSEFNCCKVLQSYSCLFSCINKYLAVDSNGVITNCSFHAVIAAWLCASSLRLNEHL